ncbi:ATP-binding protein [Comamonas testosteroni]|uniref:ATP-binding protein n=1 Tax=Comamonas testosteroni TaxID=285 RepID=UPI00391A4277
MNVFVAGVHGVGKTYMCERVVASHGFTHASASRLIREQLALPEWRADKLVADIDGNQRALIAAIERYERANTPILLDGHFLLKDRAGVLKEISTDVFAALNLGGVILLEKDPEEIRLQIAGRDDRDQPVEHLKRAMELEKARAVVVCTELGLPLKKLKSPTEIEFAQTALRLFANK